jgi:hypothetical protein
MAIKFDKKAFDIDLDFQIIFWSSSDRTLIDI